MMGYTILETDNMPEVLNNKPRWVMCATVAFAIIAITTSAVAVGAVIGYTYCYIEHQSHYIMAGNTTNSMRYQIMQLPEMIESVEYLKNNSNRTINGAFSSVLIARLMNIGHDLLISEDVAIPICSNDTSADMFRVL